MQPMPKRRANVFGMREANRQLKRYRNSGPAKTTWLLFDALAAERVEGLTLLDIGGDWWNCAQAAHGVCHRRHVDQCLASVRHPA